MSGLSCPPSTVRRALQDLRKADLFKTEQLYRTKGGKSSLLYKKSDVNKTAKKYTFLQGAIVPTW